MLKALELFGFKSFADRTRFEFPPGITVVVGPNGSGKSNIVDAIKWVLGEQSAKSLRGKDMADVIFKGTSGPSGRKASNSAEASIILDNSTRILAFDADEVHLTRRVFRSGEGEYLINGDACRLKDIKNLIRGTGVGTDAYSLIEQGKVERLLQASAKDRRAIFEEAAGISRFKAKKVEAQRRLARVEQNLVRLHDIVEEVGRSYRSIKSQASKAARYKEYTTRLQELRTHVGRTDWRKFTEKLEKLEADRNELQGAVATLSGEIETLEKQGAELENQWDTVSRSYTAQQDEISTHREQIASLESTVSLNKSRDEDLGSRIRLQRDQLAKVTTRFAEFQDRVEACKAELQNAEQNRELTLASLSSADRAVNELGNTLTELKSNNEQRRQHHVEMMAAIAELGKRVSSTASKQDSATQSKNRYQTEVDQLAEQLGLQRQVLESVLAEQQRLKSEAEAKDSALAHARQETDEALASLEAASVLLAKTTSEHAGLVQRAEVIQDLENKLDGINSGVKEVLSNARDASGPWKDVVGLVADLVQVNVEHAGIVDIALGEIAQFVVVNGHNLTRAIADEKVKIQGRVGFVNLDSPPVLGAFDIAGLQGQTGIIGRADQLVQANDEYDGFVKRMLGGTWLVKRLADALHLRSTKSDLVRYVTLDGEVVEADGTIVIGSRTSVTGIVSRRSELRALYREINRFEVELTTQKETVTELKSTSKGNQKRCDQLLGEHTEIARQLAEQENLAKTTQKQIDQLHAGMGKSTRELDKLASELTQFSSQLNSDRTKLAELEKQVDEINNTASATDERIEQLESQRTDHQQNATTLKVQLAKADQLFEDRKSRADRDHQEFADLESSIRTIRSDLATGLWSQRAAVKTVVAITKELVEKYGVRDRLVSEMELHSAKRTSIETKRREATSQLNRSRDEFRKTQDKLHQIELRHGQLNLERNQLAERLRDDYQIDIGELANSQETTEEEERRKEVETEIADLRKKIGSIGAVNMDALAELEESEARYESLNGQYQDLIQAKESLEKIIHRINNDSRRLFVETLESIRTNFQQLFRQTFGGGRADIVLEEGVDVLDAGVEIIATPPGKPEFNNSLLSGGEKALTAVSLLMAIFKFRPSPFCVLDEVDAPFDEANIGRFIDVLKSFLSWTKFVIVTHSKKTMTAATTLYGVTMQESGISKRVSVRFEEVGEDGEINKAARKSGSDGDDDRRGVA